MAKGIVTPELIEQLKAIVGEKFVYTDKDKLEPYSHDEVTDPHYMKEPQVVVLPANTEEVAKVVKLCYDNDTGIVPRAAGTGLAAGAVATFGGVIISIERMNKILEIDKQNMVCVTEPGVTTAVLQEEVQKEPTTALDGGEDGLLFYRAIADIWIPKIKTGGIVAVEIGEGQETAVARLFADAGVEQIQFEKDSGNIIRVVAGMKK